MIYSGDCLEILPTLEAESIQCVVTSPPYYGLRNYQVDGQIGLESTPEAYVEKLVAVFREVRRVLRDDGTVWLNLGDSYAANRSYQVVDNKHIDVGNNKASSIPSGLKPKDLIGIPWRVAFALQADGWWLRSDIIWHKPNPMPESVTDRPTRSHEYLFLLVKSQRYYYDAEAIKEACQSGPSDIKKMQESRDRIGGKHKDLIDPFSKASSATKIGQKRSVGHPTGRNRRSVWTITTKPFKEAHFATFPPEIPEICIKAGTSEKGCCPECGNPWERIIERTGHENKREPAHQPGNTPTKTDSTGWAPLTKGTNRWQPTCTHNLDPIPCTVLDPFSGAGTTGQVAERLDREYIGIELNPAYSDMGERRIEAARLPLFQEAL